MNLKTWAHWYFQRTTIHGREGIYQESWLAASWRWLAVIGITLLALTVVLASNPEFTEWLMR